MTEASDEGRSHPAAWYALPQPQFLGGNDARLLRGGDEYFPALIAAIDASLHEVWLATYIFHSDTAAEGVARALARASHRGVRVRVVVDGFGTHSALGSGAASKSRRESPGETV